MPRAETDTRTRIIDATIRLVRAEPDVAAISVRRIMAAAEVNLNSVNYHFRTKDNLIQEAVTKIIGDFLVRQPRHAPPADPVRRLKQLAAVPARFLAEEPNVARVSILSDLTRPRDDDLTVQTARGFLEPLRQLRPRASEADVLETASLLTAAVQHLFLRAPVIKRMTGLDFFDSAEREKLLDRTIDQLVAAPAKARATR